METKVKNVVSNKVYNTTKKENKAKVKISVDLAKNEVHKIIFCYSEIRKNLSEDLKTIFRNSKKDESKFFVNCLLNELSLSDFLRLSKNSQKFSLSQVGNYITDFATKVNFKMYENYLGSSNDTYLNGTKIYELLCKNNETENFEVSKDTLLEILPLLSKYLTKKEIEVLNSFEIEIENFAHLIKDTKRNVSKQKSLEIENERLRAEIKQIIASVKIEKIESLEIA
jgi:hypothetical protein